MPYLHCMNCHHEYEAVSESETCDWCGSHGYVLEEQTPLEKLVWTWERDPAFRDRMLNREDAAMKVNRVTIYLECDCGCKFSISAGRNEKPKGRCPSCRKFVSVAGRVTGDGEKDENKTGDKIGK